MTTLEMGIFEETLRKILERFLDLLSSKAVAKLRTFEDCYYAGELYNGVALPRNFSCYALRTSLNLLNKHRQNIKRRSDNVRRVALLFWASLEAQF